MFVGCCWLMQSGFLEMGNDCHDFLIYNTRLKSSLFSMVGQTNADISVFFFLFFFLFGEMCSKLFTGLSSR
jgi:hypothetical protein